MVKKMFQIIMPQERILITELSIAPYIRMTQATVGKAYISSLCQLHKSEFISTFAQIFEEPIS